LPFEGEITIQSGVKHHEKTEIHPPPRPLARLTVLAIALAAMTMMAGPATAQIDWSAIAWCYRTIDLHHPDWETPSFSLSNKNTS